MKKLIVAAILLASGVASANDTLIVTGEKAKGGTVKSGVWQATPGLTHSIKGETFEFCHILEGVIELTENGKAPVIYRAGDSFVMKPGYIGTWRTIETVRKIYVTVA